MAMFRKILLFAIRFAIPALMLVCFSPLSSSRASETVEKNVLIVLPYTHEYIAHSVLIKGIKRAFAEQKQYDVKFSFEFLDLSRFANEEEYLSEVAKFFQKKYSRLKPDVVLTGATLSGFMLDNGKTMFPGVPMLFVRNEYGSTSTSMPDGYYMMSGTVDFEESFRVIIQTRPLTKTIHVVVGDSDEERRMMEHVSLAEEKFSGRVAFEHLNTMPYSQMVDRVRSLGEESAVLFVRWIKDCEGKTFFPIEIARTICQESKAPVYTATSHLLGIGVVGGYSYSFDLLGKNIVARTMDIFEGKHPVSPTPMSTVNEYAFDWRQLQRWKIDERLLPPGSRIEFREESAWDMYRGYVLAGVAVLILETMLIGGLVANRVRRRKVEAELKRLNESLEGMVASRTRQLQEANAELEQAKRTLEDMNTRLDTVSRTDSLTGLFNRRHLDEYAQREHARYVRTGKRFSVVMCDIDFFKNVNDKHGHDAGDSLLRMVGQDIAQAVRPYDILVRWGGEEFLLFLPSTESGLACAIAERIRLDIGERGYAYEDHSLHLSATLGVATVREGESVADVIRRADEAMYEGKRSGRNRVVES